MRTVITHFYNEAYLLPWWLKHHTALFDHGILIDHGSTDGSADIVRELAPHWRLVRSRLMRFDAYMTDLEVMNYEWEMPGWKIALNTTEFLLPTAPLDVIENQLLAWGRTGCASSGIICIDHCREALPLSDLPLPTQKHWGFDDNSIPLEQRLSLGLSRLPERNRFYHCNSVGMYHPGRHTSYHPDSNVRLNDLMVFTYTYAPWNDQSLQRKLQIKTRLNPADLAKGWGKQHLHDVAEWEAAFQRVVPLALDLYTLPQAHTALNNCAARWAR